MSDRPPKEGFADYVKRVRKSKPSIMPERVVTPVISKQIQPIAARSSTNALQQRYEKKQQVAAESHDVTKLSILPNKSNPPGYISKKKKSKPFGLFRSAFRKADIPPDETSSQAPTGTRHPVTKALSKSRGLPNIPGEALVSSNVGIVATKVGTVAPKIDRTRSDQEVPKHRVLQPKKVSPILTSADVTIHPKPVQEEPPTYPIILTNKKPSKRLSVTWDKGILDKPKEERKTLSLMPKRRKLFSRPAIIGCPVVNKDGSPVRRDHALLNKVSQLIESFERRKHIKDLQDPGDLQSVSDIEKANMLYRADEPDSSPTGNLPASPKYEGNRDIVQEGTQEQNTEWDKTAEIISVSTTESKVQPEHPELVKTSEVTPSELDKMPDNVGAPSSEQDERPEEADSAKCELKMKPEEAQPNTETDNSTDEPQPPKQENDQPQSCHDTKNDAIEPSESNATKTEEEEIELIPAKKWLKSHRMKLDVESKGQNTSMPTTLKPKAEKDSKATRKTPVKSTNSKNDKKDIEVLNPITISLPLKLEARKSEKKNKEPTKAKTSSKQTNLSTDKLSKRQQITITLPTMQSSAKKSSGRATAAKAKKSAKNKQIDSKSNDIDVETKDDKVNKGKADTRADSKVSRSSDHSCSIESFITNSSRYSVRSRDAPFSFSEGSYASKCSDHSDATLATYSDRSRALSSRSCRSRSGSGDSCAYSEARNNSPYSDRSRSRATPYGDGRISCATSYGESRLSSALSRSFTNSTMTINTDIDSEMTPRAKDIVLMATETAQTSGVHKRTVRTKNLNTKNNNSSNNNNNNGRNFDLTPLPKITRQGKNKSLLPPVEKKPKFRLARLTKEAKSSSKPFAPMTTETVEKAANAALARTTTKLSSGSPLQRDPHDAWGNKHEPRKTEVAAGDNKPTAMGPRKLAKDEKCLPNGPGIYMLNGKPRWFH